jgi:uncharacterized protein (TIGR00255 family)
MLKSMTGYGRSEKQNGTLACKAEIRSVNNQRIKSQCARGSFDLHLALEVSGENGSDQEIKPNLGLARQYVNAFRQIQQELNLSGDLQIESLLNVKDIVKTEAMTLDDDQKNLIMETVDEALRELIQMRRDEGKNLEEDLASNLDSIEILSKEINKRQPIVVEEYRNRLGEKIQTLAAENELDPARLSQEVAIFADRCDIAEEIIRLGSHVNQFREFLKSEESMGRKLEFITQEINRETNTIGSKSADYSISQAVIEIKSHLEKIREQLQNVE